MSTVFDVAVCLLIDLIVIGSAAWWIQRNMIRRFDTRIYCHRCGFSAPTMRVDGEENPLHLHYATCPGRKAP